MTTHGMSWKPEYVSWRNMVARCTKPQNKDYRHYGGRGIRVCERWRTFANFFDDMGRMPSRQFTLERIDNDGNYEPGNCRWATRVEQGRNTRPPLNRTSGIRGVCWDKAVSRWKAYITTRRKKRVIGWFDALEEAAAARSLAEKADWSAAA